MRLKKLYTKFCSNNLINNYKNIIIGNVIENKNYKYNNNINKYILNKNKNKHIFINISSIYNDNIIDYLDNYAKISKKNNNKIIINGEGFKNRDIVNYYSDYCIDKYTNIYYKTYQMYYKKSFRYLTKDLQKFNNHNIFLVKGNYFDNNEIYDNKKNIDYNFRMGIKLLSNKKNNTIIATNDLKSCDLALQLNKNFMFAQYYGYDNVLSEYIKNKDRIVFKYLPIGECHESIPYLCRIVNNNYDIMNYL